MPVKNLSQSVTLKAAPKDVYDALVDPKIHAEWTGDSAELDPRPGGKFGHYGGSLNGFVLDLVKARRIVLAWRSADWPEGHYSIVQITLGKVTGGTKLAFAQYGIPGTDFEDISDGWRTYYWTPLREYLEG